ncbi:MULTISPECIES: FeoA family protein [Clostridium]|uniref:Ferrous iron transport protein A n=1 Tax=Clostridium sulfidigenes TaxID=318464 RepID=A0A084JBI0_9CLOT|nr:ferrous iron transport protein A [Clostridium sulfidigenes]HAR85439.1 ferrous iron transport protein A [Clostridium sp.]KEZ86314.1 iron transporter FeoA [Clostridium sulfidigenes]MBE6061340.1 ferrous iron transport protein A [Clostridium sulfidigenes]HBA03588.1 ferrous iron transport protein A [Clostridium sp.]HBL06032.1 ferrous iron transport protein A [Clostridium sp.]
MNVFNLKPGDKGLIKELACDDRLAKRLLALGFVEGTEVLVKKTAPLGDPIIINLRGTDLAIRKKDAELIFIKEAV